MKLKHLFLSLAAFAALSASAAAVPENAPEPAAAPAESLAPKYVFYFIGDGMGWAHVINADLYKTGVLKEPSMSMLSMPVVGLARTHSANSRVTDSAAAGTALSTGHKTRNGMLGMDADTTAVVSIAKVLFDRGWGVGLVTTSAIDDATPAAFYAHVDNRGQKETIGRQLAESGYQFAAGAGPEAMYKNVGLPAYFKEKGYTVSYGKSGLDVVADKVLVLSPDTVKTWECDYAIDSVPDALHLPDMTAAAIRHLSRVTPDHFFLMVEGGIIDHAAHSNDGGTAVREVLAFDQSIQLAMQFYASHPDETLIVVTADHETGGFSVGDNTSGYAVYPEKVAAEKISKSEFENYVKSLARNRRVYRWNDMKEYLTENLGFWKTVDISAGETAELKKMFEEMMAGRSSAADQETLYASFRGFTAEVFRLLNDKAGFGWTSTKHTGSPVPVLAMGPGAYRFSALNDNTELPRKILGIVLGPGTACLR